MRLDRLQLRLDRLLAQMVATSRDQVEAVPVEDRAQHRGIVRNLLPSSMPAKPALVPRPNFERDVAAQFRQIVVAPADRADAEAHGHRPHSPCSIAASLAQGAAGLRP